MFLGLSDEQCVWSRTRNVVVVVTMLQAQKSPCSEMQTEHSIEVHAYTGSVDICT